MRKNILWLLIIISSFGTFYLSGCVPSKPTDETEILPSERLINKLEANRRRIRNFEGNGTLSVKSDQFDNSATFRIVLEKPDSMYLTIMGPFGVELAQAMVTKQNFIFYDVLHNTAYKGKINSEILKDIFKINLSFQELMDSFIGSVNLTSHLYKQPDNYKVDGDKYVLTYIDSTTGQKTIYKVDIRQLGITDYIIENSDGDKILEGKYSKFDILENVAVPYKIDIVNYDQNQQVSIDYKRMEANKSDLVIDFNVPDDATIIKW